MTAASLKGRYEEFQVVAKQRDSFYKKLEMFQMADESLGHNGHLGYPFPVM